MVKAESGAAAATERHRSRVDAVFGTRSTASSYLLFVVSLRELLVAHLFRLGWAMGLTWGRLPWRRRRALASDWPA